jgi:hypothetical protein
MIKKIFLLSLMILTLSSCKKSEFENLLLNPHKKWSYINNSKYNRNSIALFYMKFYENGDFENRYTASDQKHILLDGEQRDCYWSYSEKDSILELCDYTYKILEYQKDTIRLIEVKNNFKCLFVNHASKK